MGNKNMQEKNDNQQQFQYENLEGCQITQEEKCFALAFNQSCSCLVAGSDFNIKVFKFDYETLEQTQLLIGHQGYIQTLNFMKQTNQRFISGSCDSLIIIWELNILSSLWYKKQTLNYHILSITCLIINKNEDFFFSGSCDKTIKLQVMNHNQEWVCKQSIIEHSSYINGLSLNNDQNKLITCGQDQKILIIQNIDDNWIVIQKIEQYGLRLCFIFDDFFTFQPNGNFMYTYQLESNQQIVNYKQRKINLKRGGCVCTILFPQYFIQSKSLLVNKNGGYVHFVKILDQNRYQKMQTINFGTYQVFGEISSDGQYFVSWDDLSNQIQIKKYIEY
ncbi:unnamed protein product [Paramecium primaurelia]|uniref:WD40-repeat-containing domain n=1 Tax=Paramecium primaurelia TaxID=5886 RepID=A0A8S1NQU5_PARPR|nr:unnamed protein product [Paramecium primaurelia]